ncbi:2-phospho-L-lactate transferase [Halospeciosus flavus]|uniref:2-phospho-L-lactate transferase n=1 Tax=Halospeciosus flavus TaxID=3032283 RepID=A0ABD5Z8W1_9EURY|nr:2-phospho-L-lactate transferase [Halospeciosus flavus]
MTTFLAGGTGTPKLLAGADEVFDPDETTVVANTGDDVELGGLFVCPDVDTVLFERGGVLDTETWWGLEDDPTETHDYLRDLSERVGIDTTPRYLPDEEQTAGRDLAAWRRFSAAGEFMTIGDRDRAVHLLRTSLLDEGHSLTEVTRALADAYDLTVDLVPMSDDPVASIVHTPDEEMHFQEYWVGRRGDADVLDVEFRGSKDAAASDAAVEAVRSGPVVVGPSNPVTSIGPMLTLPRLVDALRETTVVAVSPFVEDTVFSGPADDLMEAVGYEPSTAGVAEAYPFADAFVLDDEDGTDLDRPVVRTDTEIDDAADAERVARAVRDAIETVETEGHAPR